MAYSKNVKYLIIKMCDQMSAEEVEAFLSKQHGEAGYSVIKEQTEKMDLPFSPADWQCLNGHTPTAKTMRTWVADKSLVMHLETKSRAKLKKDQIEHIALLQQIAIVFREKVDIIPKWRKKGADLDAEYLELMKVAFELTRRAEWEYLEGHLGSTANKIKTFADQFGYTLPKKSPADRLNQIDEARYLLTNSLFPIAIHGDPGEWVAYGLNIRCPGCVT